MVDAYAHTGPCRRRCGYTTVQYKTVAIYAIRELLHLLVGKITLACIAHIITMLWSCNHHTYYYSCKNVCTTYCMNPTRVIGGRIRDHHGDRSRGWHDGGWNFSIWNQCVDYIAPNRTGRVLTGNVIAVRQSTEDMVAIECIICNEPNGCLPRPLHGTTLVGKYCI